jgi:hypothetical protein
MDRYPRPSIKRESATETDQTSQSGRKYWLKIACSFFILFIGLELLIITQSTSVVSESPSQKNRPLAISSSSSLLPFELPPQSDLSRVGQPVTTTERQLISQILGYDSVPNYSTQFHDLPLFILHDTAGELSAETLNAKKIQAKGPFGDGIAVYILRDGHSIIKRPRFFTPYRPTASAYEKALDILPENTRNHKARQVWSFLHPNAQKIALNELVSNIPDVNTDILLKRATLWLNSPSERAFARYKSVDGGKTTGLWTVGYICDMVVNNPANTVNLIKAAEFAPQLQQVCAQLHSALSQSRARVASGVNIELNQQRGSDCWVNNAEVRRYNAVVPKSSIIPENRVVTLQTLERPAYTDSQYQYLAYFYLWAALQAGYYPQITTHFWLDQGKVGKIGDHCDPRGINLTYLYQQISELLDHPWGTLYGIEPKYGLSPDQGDNVWWAESVLGAFP